MASIITSPSEIDILCGKDKTFNKHPGNLLYRQLIEEHAQSYTSTECSKQIKMKVTKDIVSQLQRSGARFIRKIVDKGWQEISDQEARDKTSHALRYCAGLTNGKRPQAATGHRNTPIHSVIKRAAKAKREHRRIVSNDYNTADHPFSNHLMAPLFDGGLHHHHSFVSYTSSPVTMVEVSPAAFPDYCLSLHPSISLGSLDEVGDVYDDEEASNDYYCNHRPAEEQHEEYGYYDTSSVNNEESAFPPDQVDSTYYYSTPTTPTEHTTTTASNDVDSSAGDDDDLEQILQEPLGVVSHDDIWDDHQYYHQSS